MVIEKSKLPKKFKHGDILEIPLHPYLNRYCYAKYIDYSKAERYFHYFIPQRLIVYDHFANERVSSISEIESRELLCNPLYITWSTSLRGLEGWMVVGNEKVKESDFVPVYVRKLIAERINIRPNEFEALTWYSLLDTNTSFTNQIEPWKKYPWKNIKHLEHAGHTSLNAIPLRIYLEWCKVNNVNLDVSKINKNGWYAVYLRCCDIPIYSKIPIEFRQKPIPIEEELPWTDENEIYFNYPDWYELNQS